MSSSKCALYAMAVVATTLSGAAKAATFTVLVNFGCCSTQAPAFPVGEPRVDAQGNIYVVTQGGGTSNYGTVYRWTPTGQSKTLYEFPYDLQRPAAGASFDSKGRLVGTTQGYIPYGTYGSSYALGPNYQQHSIVFQSNNGGPYSPESAFASDGRGNMITTSYYGGTYDAGTIFRISPEGKLSYYSLPFEDQRVAPGLLTVDSHGNAYGASGFANDGGGALFKLSPEGKFTTVYNFNEFDGCSSPTAGYVINTRGDLFGSTKNEYLTQGGCIFRIEANGDYSVSYQFPSSNSFGNGQSPNGDLTADASGNLYGTTEFGGAFGDGVVFELSRNGEETVLHSFSGSDGFEPTDGVVLAPDGTLYGVAYSGGTNGKGVLYKISRTN